MLFTTGTLLPVSSDPKAEWDKMAMKKKTLTTKRIVNTMRHMSCVVDEAFFLLAFIVANSTIH